MTAGNIQLIKSIRAQYLDKVQNAVMQAMVRGSLNKDLAAQIKDLGKTTEKQAMFIARDQSSKLNAALTQARHEEVGIKKYMWSASLDERVRESHAEKDGQIFEYSNPPADTGHPGHDFNCRCVQIPVLDTEQEKQIIEQYEVDKVKEAISPSQYRYHVGDMEQNPVAMEFVKKYNLSTKEAVSIRDYTTNSYAKINSQLREDKAAPSILMMAKVIIMR
ncbi:TPA: phage minor head protein [Haemophilus influenzae]|uniref:phage minor head protein n=1 Tax=Haemophilus influenzae TaxID=727 RepID=UPI001682C2BA|nr:phage minor head protein [Haemophilus influenzae]